MNESWILSRTTNPLIYILKREKIWKNITFTYIIFISFHVCIKFCLLTENEIRFLGVNNILILCPKIRLRNAFLLQRRFTWAYRQRIRVTLQGKDLNMSEISVHDKATKRPKWVYGRKEFFYLVHRFFLITSFSYFQPSRTE